MPGFRHCNWCQGSGCICCDAEQAKWEAREAERQKARDAEYDRLFPNGPTPIFTATRSNPDDMAAMGRIVKAMLHPEGIADVPPLASGAMDMLGITGDERKAVEHKIKAEIAVERTAASERFLQRHRPDAPEYKPIGNSRTEGKP